MTFITDETATIDTSAAARTALERQFILNFFLILLSAVLMIAFGK